MNNNFCIKLTPTRSKKCSNPDHPECFCSSKNVSKDSGVAHNHKIIFVPLPIRYASSFFYKNFETLREIGTRSTFFFIVSIFFLPTSTYCETALVSPSTLEKATLDRITFMLTTAEESMSHEAYDTARTHLFEVASWQCDDIQTLFRLGLNLIKIGEFQKSVGVFKRILNREPNNLSVLYNCGYALKNDGHNDAAVIYYKNVLARDPNHDATHLALGYALLNKGDFANGWPQHERYLKKSGKYAPELRALLAENNLAGKRILLFPEGGLGDTIHFIQCAQLLRDRGAYVIASVQKPLVQLLQRCDCVDEVITGIPAGFKYDARVTYMSLPAALHLDETTIPKHNPYLHADLLLVDFWKKKLTHDASLKVGVCWQADLPHDESRLPVARRSIPLALLAQLADVPGVTLYSLQTHEHNAACHTQELESCIQTFEYKIDTEHGPFMDTAALIANMDIVITVDTATAHLAAALGKPTWLLLPYATDWRWIAHRTDSPWHPTMRIFKQPKPFDWQSVIDAVTTALV
jgi:tetratricopeptide (TPR) repeat protein